MTTTASRPQAFAPEVPFFESHILRRIVYFTELSQLPEAELDLLAAEVDSDFRNVCVAYTKRREDPDADIGGIYGAKQGMGVFQAGVRSEIHRRRVAAQNPINGIVDKAVAAAKHELAQARESRDYWRAEAQALGAGEPPAMPGEAKDPAVMRQILKADPSAMKARARLVGLSDNLQQRLGQKATTTIEARFMALCARELPPAEFARLVGLAAGEGREQLEAAGAELLQALQEGSSTLKALANGCIFDAEPEVQL